MMVAKEEFGTEFALAQVHELGDAEASMRAAVIQFLCESEVLGEERQSSAIFGWGISLLIFHNELSEQSFLLRVGCSEALDGAESQHHE